ncbi:MAG TPA: DUF177 domain-containing protein [Hypericibacter adhaerens]|jgi:hypothetical protein|uniref:DUF177 domain-containing protein n=1 Tax=Hypericibacter adhaerens TaxID=2602016 RepID=UPI002C96C73B|nr:DUF177 domain-containing protein [Hypericibacter adhaerens]HWA42888.1 DUF177 domain-containing protein [Hypericibacter adhaerens]
MAEPQLQPEFSRPIRVERIGRDEIGRQIEAKPAEREALAVRLGLESLDLLRAELRLKRLSRGRIAVEGRLQAKLTQLCVASLAPVASEIEGEFAVEFVEAEPGPEAEAVVSVESEAPPEPIEEGAIDLGETVVQELAERIDPYPRAPGADVTWRDEAPGEPEPKRPFAALSALQGKKKG